MDVSIVIVAWNVKNLLHECLKSVFEQTRDIEFEVVYVDNASSDGSVEMVADEFTGVRIIKNEQNAGFIKANNQAIPQCKGRYVLLLNSDTVVLDNAIAKMVRFADTHTDSAVVGCKVLNPDKTLQRTCFMFPSALNMLLSATYLYKIFPKNRFFGRERMTWWDFNDVREVETVCGCCSLVRKEAIDLVGLMDERYFVYGDDPDWCYRFKKAGWKVMYTPEPQIIHYGGQTTQHRRREFRWQLHGSELIFIKLYKGWMEFILARLFTSMFLLLRVPYWCAVALLNRQARDKAMETSKTYLMGGIFCLFNWRRLLMNKQALEGRF